MSELVTKLKWDSDFFGWPIGRIIPTELTPASLASILAQAQADRLACLYFEANPDDLHTVRLAEANGFALVDVRVVLEHPFDGRPAPSPRYPISPQLIVEVAQPADLARLIDIGLEVGRTSRYNFDEYFRGEPCDRLYRAWIENSFQGFADVILVARWAANGDAAGLITCRVKEGVGHIHLAGVHSDQRQRGVGTGLVQAALDWTKANGGRGMEVVTQARNVPAQRLYQQMGFFTKLMNVFYHKWL
jgi:dTDP-4-amino-4,6-dideoxy-D-galactose acyltransferase